MLTAPTADQTTILGDEVERLLLGGPLAGLVAEVVHAPFFEVRLSTGSTILARSAANEGKYLRGRSAHRVVVDEAAFCSERTVQEAILPMLADTAGQLVLISTPFGRNHFWEAYRRRGRHRRGLRRWRLLRRRCRPWGHVTTGAHPARPPRVLNRTEQNGKESTSWRRHRRAPRSSPSS